MTLKQAEARNPHKVAASKCKTFEIKKEQVKAHESYLHSVKKQHLDGGFEQFFLFVNSYGAYNVVVNE